MTTFEQYPRWARPLAHGIRARLGNTFVLHGNTHDVVPVPKPAGEVHAVADFVPITRFLADWIFGQREVVIEFQRANGAVFLTREGHRHFTDAVAVMDSVHGTGFSRALPREPVAFCALLDGFLKQVVHRQSPLGVAVILPYAETLVPESSGEASADDRAVRVYIQKWSTDPALLAANVTFVLVTENLADLSARIVRSPQTVEIEVGRPDEAERRQFLQAVRGADWFATRSDVPLDRLAQVMSGLTRIQIRQILDADRRTRFPSRRQGAARAEEGRHRGRVLRPARYVESRHGLDMVSGHDGVKTRLRRAAQAILAGRLQGVPMGYLIAGPVGSAKTFLVNCFTGEIGFPCVKFLNFRSQWQGVTEGNLEKILKVLHAMWPVGVIIDEADAFLGDRNQQGDSGTSNRVFASLASFMGNTDYRGKIVWFLITSRPDLLPVDLKRQGRAEEHLALFYPQTAEEHDALFRIMLAKAGVVSDATSITQVSEDPSGLSGADIEAILARALLSSEVNAEGRPVASVEVLRNAFADFIPATSQLEREMQILAAVQECTSREVLPERYRSMDRNEVFARLNELRALLKA